jgi:hypothetical protein
MLSKGGLKGDVCADEAFGVWRDNNSLETRTSRRAGCFGSRKLMKKLTGQQANLRLNLVARRHGYISGSLLGMEMADASGAL